MKSVGTEGTPVHAQSLGPAYMSEVDSSDPESASDDNTLHIVNTREGGGASDSGSSDYMTDDGVEADV